MEEIKENVRPMGRNLLETVKDMISEDQPDEPFYVADLSDVMEKYRQWKKKLPRVHPHYAIKTNADMVLLKLMASFGCGFDCASRGEIELALAAGAKPSDIIYAHPFKSRSFLRHAKSKNIDLLTFDSEGELFKIKEIHPNARLLIRFRVPNVVADFPLNNKFGCEMEDCYQLLKVAKRLGLKVVGTCFHVGGLCKEPAAYTRAIKMSSEIFDIGKELGHKFTLLDLGGGFPGDSEYQDFFSKACYFINQSLQEYFPEDSGVQIMAEPGCYFACSSFSLCTTIIGKKKLQQGGKLSEEIMYYLNDSTYGSFPEMYEHYGVRMKPLLSASEYRRRPLLKSKLWGCTCCNLDCITEKCLLPEMEIGEQIIFENMGAYTLSIASNFNGFLKPSVRYVYKTNKKDNALKTLNQKASTVNDWKVFVDCKRYMYAEDDDSNSDLCRFG